MNASNLVEQYFRHQDREDLPGSNVFTAYVQPRYQPQVFTVSVTDGTLDVSCVSTDTYACTLSALVVYPSRLQPLADTFFKDMWGLMETEFGYECVVWWWWWWWWWWCLQSVPALRHAVWGEDCE